MPWPQFLGQPQFQVHSIIPTDMRVPVAGSSENMLTVLVHGLRSDAQKKNWLKSVDPAYYHRPEKNTSTEKKTQLTIRLGKAKPQFKCLHTIQYYVYNCAEVSRERGEWGL